MDRKIEVSLQLLERVLANDPTAEHDAMLELRALIARSDDADKVNNRQMGLTQFVEKHATTCPGHGRPECATCCWPAPAGYTAVDMSTAAANGYRDGKGEPLPRYTCIGKGGDYEFLGTATGSGTSRGAPQPYVYRDVATGQLYFREATDFYTRMEPQP